MDLNLSDEQRMLADSARAFVVRSGSNDEVWSAMAGLGWAALPTLGDVAVVCEALGWGAVQSPLIASTVTAMSITWAGNADQRDRWLPRLASGDVVGTMAVMELGMTDEWDRAHLAGGTALTGTKLLVPWANTAGVVVVTTAEGLYLVEPSAGGIVCRPHHGIGADPLFAVHLVDAPAERLGNGDHAAVVRRALDWIAVARLADVVGVAARALELTVQYAKDREQFGRPIGSFQAVAHRCVDMRTDLDACRYLAYQAAWALDRNESAELEVAAAKAYGNDALRRIFGHAHQVHGAIGFSTEHDLHRLTRRAKAFELSCGSTDRHLDRVATAIGLE
jgi:alkylation response protein AidB-like acyl-CoA dehydrogenase